MSRFFRIKKEEPEEEEVAEEALEEEVAEEALEESPKEPTEETAEELVKETLEEAEAPEVEVKPEVEVLPTPPPTPKKPDVLRFVKEDIYRLRGTLKTLEDKLDRKEITPEEYEAKSRKVATMLADLYEKKIKHELGI